jgi:glycosyltransferase involved in cell wall biosynthesis
MNPDAHSARSASLRVAFIGSAGIPNRYGGFESFLEHCAPEIARHTQTVLVTCDSAMYDDRSTDFHGVRRMFIPIRANGALSVFHDLFAFLRVIPLVDCVVVLGVSGGLWFPLFRAICAATRKQLVVNIDGVEWRRNKFGFWRRGLLRTFDSLAQRFSHRIIYDNPALVDFVVDSCKDKASCIVYSGDHVLRLGSQRRLPRTALTICRIEPENNIEMIIQGALRSSLESYALVGNWSQSEYGRQLRVRYRDQRPLALLDPIYDAQALAQLRESCETYIHGHSVGGTNPSLVEMLFYDCRLLCFDCSFNRYTAAGSADYFANAGELADLLDAEIGNVPAGREQLRARYTKQRIAAAYVALLTQSTKLPDA